MIIYNINHSKIAVTHSRLIPQAPFPRAILKYPDSPHRVPQLEKIFKKLLLAILINKLLF